MAAETFSGVPEQQSLLDDCANHLFYSAFQKPVTAVAQAIDKVSSSHLVETTKFIPTPQQAEFGSARWHVEQIAGGVGSFVPFVASMAITRPLLRPLQEPMLKAMSTASAQTVLGRYALGEAATAGFINGAVFEPSRGNGTFIGDRFKQGVTGAATMSVLHSSSNALGRFTGASAAEAGMVRKALTTGVAGVGAGGTAYLTDTTLNGRSFDAQEMVKSAYSMGFTGVALGAGADGFMRLNMPKSNLSSVDEYVARNFDGASTSDHYLGWLARQSVEGRAGLVSKWIGERISDRLGARGKIAETLPDGERHTGLAKNLKLEELAPLDRLELVAKLQRLANTNMIGDKALGSLISKLTNASEKFDKIDVAPLYERLEAAKQKVEQRFETQEKIRDWALDHRPRPITEKTETGFRTHFPDHPREVKAERRVMVAVAERNQAQRALDAVIGPRLSKMNEALNEWLAEQKLPPVEVGVGFVNGSAAYGQGRLIISPEILNATHITTNQMGLILHELVHLKQETMILKLMADEMGIGKQANPEQVTALQERAAKAATESAQRKNSWTPETETIISRDFIENILRIRNGERLTPEDARLARSFRAAQQSYTSPPWMDRQQRYVDQHLATTNLEMNLESSSLKRFLDEIHTNPRAVAEKYGFRKIPSELKQMAADAAKRTEDFESRTFKSYEEKWAAQEATFADKNTVKRAKEILAKHVEATDKRLWQFADKDYNWYMGSTLERQAYPAGITAFLFAQQRLNQTKISTPVKASPR